MSINVNTATTRALLCKLVYDNIDQYRKAQYEFSTEGSVRKDDSTRPYTHTYTDTSGIVYVLQKLYNRRERRVEVVTRRLEVGKNEKIEHLAR